MSKFCRKYTRLNTVSYIFKVEQLPFTQLSRLLCSHSYDFSGTYPWPWYGAPFSCFGHSNVVLNCKFYIGIPAYPEYLINASSVHVIVHG